MVKRYCMVLSDIHSCPRLKWTRHALEEMLLEEFGEISENEVKQALKNGEIIEDYPSDLPFPSCLVYGRAKNNRPLHVVCAPVFEEKILVVITVYEPDAAKWIDFKRRIK